MKTRLMHCSGNASILHVENSPWIDYYGDFMILFAYSTPVAYCDRDNKRWGRIGEPEDSTVTTSKYVNRFERDYITDKYTRLDVKAITLSLGIEVFPEGTNATL